MRLWTGRGDEGTGMRGYEEDTGLERVALVAADMDHTLLAEDDSLPEGMVERVRALDEAGVTFVAASGRPSLTLRVQFEGACERMAFVADNGATVSCRGTTLFASRIDPDLVGELVDFSLASGAGVPVVCTPEMIFALSRDREHDPFLSRSYYRITYVDALDGRELAQTVGVGKFTVYFPEGNAAEAREGLYVPRFADRLSVTGSGREWVDVMNPGVNKGRGLGILCEHLGIAPADALAIGDSENDREMLAVVGHSYLVANAERHMWQHARFLAPSNEDRGVAVVVDRVLAAHR